MRTTALAAALLLGLTACGPLVPPSPPPPLVEVFTATANPDGTVTLAWLADYTTTVAINTGLAVQTLPGCHWTLASPGCAGSLTVDASAVANGNAEITAYGPGGTDSAQASVAVVP